MKKAFITSSLLLALSMLILEPRIGTPETADPETADASPAAEPPNITYGDPPDADERAMVDWATDRYRQAGLAVPDVTFRFPVTCTGSDGRALAGRYLVGRSEIELCRPSRKLVLHELAHAWDDQSDVDRRAFLDARALDHWYEEPGRDAVESGGEQLARIVTWGLMDVDITWPVSEYQGQPVDDRPRVLPGLEDCTRSDLTELFVLMTGRAPLSPGRAVVDTNS